MPSFQNVQWRIQNQHKPGDKIGVDGDLVNEGATTFAGLILVIEVRPSGATIPVWTLSVTVNPQTTIHFSIPLDVAEVQGQVTVILRLRDAFGNTLQELTRTYTVVPPQPPPSPPQLVINTLTLTTPGTRNPGDPVTAVVSVANNGGQPGSADLVFRERWPNGQEVNIGTPSPITLQPGQSQSYQRTWGAPGVTGNITVRAELRVGGAVISFREASYQVVQPPPPAQLVITELTITTSNIRNPGEPLGIRVRVTNSGGQEGSAHLSIIEIAQDNSTRTLDGPTPITVPPQQSTTREVSVSANNTPGPYTIRALLTSPSGAPIGSAEVTYRVVQPPPSQPPPSGGSPLLPIGLGAGIALGLYLLKRRRKR